jgi:hypothetical protein
MAAAYTEMVRGGPFRKSGIRMAWHECVHIATGLMGAAESGTIDLPKMVLILNQLPRAAR